MARIEETDAGSHHAVLHRHFLCRGLSVREGLPKAEVSRMSLVTALALLCSVLLLIYLAVSLLYPEKF